VRFTREDKRLPKTSKNDFFTVYPGVQMGTRKFNTVMDSYSIQESRNTTSHLKKTNNTNETEAKRQLDGPLRFASLLSTTSTAFLLLLKYGNIKVCKRLCLYFSSITKVVLLKQSSSKLRER